MYSELVSSISKVKVYSIVTVILIIVGSAVSYWTAKRIEFYTGALMHNEKVLQRTGELYSSILERETNIRGYIITEDREFLTHYRQSVIDAERLLSDLQNLTKDFESQQNNIEELRALIENRVRTFETTIEYMEKHDSLEGFLNTSRTADALTNYSLIKKLVNKINSEENELFISRNQSLINNINALPFIVGLIALFSITIGFMTFFSIYQYNIAQKRTSKRINDYQQRLGEQIQLLDDSNKELEQFAYVASHDLQEPLRKITAFSDLLNDQYGEILEGEGALYLSRITASAVRMRRLITDLLEYSRTGKHTLDQLKEVDLNQVIRGVVEDMEITLQDKDATIDYSDLPILNGVETEFQQVFQNLISNALKFSDPEKKPLIKITSEPATKEVLKGLMGLDPDLSYHHLKVSDNGIGFNAEHAERIFSIFQRLHGKTEYEGTGIGLSIIRKIIENYDGRIFAESTLGEGAVFHIILPTFHS